MKTSISEAGENRGMEVRVPPAIDHGIEGWAPGVRYVLGLVS